jgi:hypothetical protein
MGFGRVSRVVVVTLVYTSDSSPNNGGAYDQSSNPFLSAGRAANGGRDVDRSEYRPRGKEDEPTVKKVLAAYPKAGKARSQEPAPGRSPQSKPKALVAECMGVGRYWQAQDQYNCGPAEKCRGRRQRGQTVDMDLALSKRLGLATTTSFVIDGIRNGGTLRVAPNRRRLTKLKIQHAKRDWPPGVAHG